MKHGYGYSYRKNGTLAYEGYWENDNCQGHGKAYFGDGKAVKFDGEYLNGDLIKGIEYYRNGNVHYNGTWENGKYSGGGSEYDENGNLIHGKDFPDEVLVD